MSKKVKIFISALAVALLLTVGATATVMANDEELAPPPEAGTGLLARVAEILEFDKDDLINAFKQARQEMLEAQQQNRKEALIRALDRAVEKGWITQEQDDEIINWWQQRPETLKPNLLRRAHIFQARRDRQMIAVPRGWCQPGPPKLAD